MKFAPVAGLAAAHQRFIHPAKLVKRQGPQAAAERIANQQGTGEHGGAKGHAEENGEIPAAMVDQVA